MTECEFVVQYKYGISERGTAMREFVLVVL